MRENMKVVRKSKLGEKMEIKIVEDGSRTMIDSQEDTNFTKRLKCTRQKQTNILLEHTDSEKKKGIRMICLLDLSELLSQLSNSL